MASMTSLAASIVLLAAGAGAFVPPGLPQPSPEVSALHATEAFQRSLLASRLGTQPPSRERGGSTTADYLEGLAGADAPTNAADDHEKFQQSLLEAKLAYDSTLAEVTAAVAADRAPPPAAVDDARAALAGPVVSAPAAEADTTAALVPVNEANVQFAAGALGAAAGLVLVGPVFGAVAAAGGNYLARKDGDGAARAPRAVGAAALAALRGCNLLAGPVSAALGGAARVARGKASPVADAADQAAATLEGMVQEAGRWNDEYDLLGGAVAALGAVGDIVEKSVDKVVDLNEEYQLLERAGRVVKGALDKAAEE